MLTQITKNFNFEEFLCKCPRCAGKLPSKAIQANIIKTIHTLQPIRDKTGKAFTVNCGFRCPAHNKEVGGVANSVHMTGLAADITIAGMTSEQMFVTMAGINTAQIPSRPKTVFTGVGYYPDKGFVHVDIGPMKPRPNTWKIED